MRVNVTPGVLNLIKTIQRQKSSSFGLVVAAKFEEEWYSNTAAVSEKVLDMVLGTEEHSELNKYLKENKDVSIIPIIGCRKMEDADLFIRDINTHGYELCIITADDGIGLYQLKGSEIKKETISMVPRLSRHLEERISDLMDITIAEYRIKGKKSFSKDQH